MTIRVVSETIAWDAIAGSTSYDLLVNGVKKSSTKYGLKAQFTLADGDIVRVVAQPSGEWQEITFDYSVELPTPPPPPPPPPPPTNHMYVGCIGDIASPGGWGQPIKNELISLKAEFIREERGDFGIPWAHPLGIKVISIGSNVGDVAELDNEPYNNDKWINGDFALWARTMRDRARSWKQANSIKTVLLPIGPPWNNGDVKVNGVWKDCIKAVYEAAPDIGGFIDGYAIHPYAQPNPPSIRNVVLDKWRSNAKIAGYDLAFWVTEFGYPTDGTKWPKTSEANQALWMKQEIDYLRSRGDVRAFIHFKANDHQPYGASTDSEFYFGAFRSNGSEKPVAAVLRAEVGL